MGLDEEFENTIIATCDNLGYFDAATSTYNKDPIYLDCVNDLALYLIKRDDDDYNIRRLLGKIQVVQSHLIPLLKYHAAEDLELFDLLLRLFEAFSQPALQLYDEQVPKNKRYLTQYLEIEKYLRAYKEAFIDKEAWTRLTSRLKHLVEMEWVNRRDKDATAMGRIIIIIRNILRVPASPQEEGRTDDESSVHDKILLMMQVSGMFDLLLKIAGSDMKREYGLYLVEICSLILREQTGEQLAKTKLSRNEEDRIKDERELIRTREKEEGLRAMQNQKMSLRHSRFGGSFTVQGMKGPSGRDMICHKVITESSDLSLDAMKKKKKTPSNRVPVKEDDCTRRSTVPVRIVLKEFCSSFLSQCYNSLMTVVKDNIVRGKMQDNDETYYLWSLKFFMEFNRYEDERGFSIRRVSDTMNINTFHYIQTLLDKYHSMMVTDKENLRYWAKRAHTAIKAYQELLFTLLWMDKFGSSRSRELSSQLKSDVFYMPEYRELCLGLLNSYDHSKFSKGYLKDLVETNHLFLKMLEEYAKSSEGRIVVRSKGVKRKKQRKQKQKSNKKTKKQKRKPLPRSEDELENLWGPVCNEILSAVEEEGLDASSTSENVIPFDATLEDEIPVEEQWTLALERIGVFLHSKKYKEAAILLRGCREVWPNKGEEWFGEGELDAVDEALVLKKIFMDEELVGKVDKKLQELEQREEEQELLDELREQDNNAGSRRGENGEEEGERRDQDEEEEPEFQDEEDEEEEEVYVTSKETEFDFLAFSLKYATGKILCAYSRLFQDWEKLKPFTLHCILKMFHRYAFDLNFPAMLCQASIFRTFQGVLKVSQYQPELKEVTKFFYHFWPKFVTLCEKYKDGSMFVEFLYWKGGREAQEIQEGYGASSVAVKRGKKDKNIWTSDEEDQLELLAEQYNELPDEVKRTTKIVEYIKERWTYKPRSKNKFIDKLVDKGFLDSAAQARKTRPPKVWGDSEIEKIRELYEEFKETDDIMGNIMPGLVLQRSKRAVIQKMLELEIIRDKAEVKKKRTRGSGNRRRKNHERLESEGNGEPTSDTEEVERNGENENDGENDRSKADESGSGSSSSESESDSESEKSESEKEEEDGASASPMSRTSQSQQHEEGQEKAQTPSSDDEGSPSGSRSAPVPTPARKIPRSPSPSRSLASSSSAPSPPLSLSSSDHNAKKKRTSSNQQAEKKKRSRSPELKLDSAPTQTGKRRSLKRIVIDSDSDDDDTTTSSNTGPRNRDLLTPSPPPPSPSQNPNGHHHSDSDRFDSDIENSPLKSQKGKSNKSRTRILVDSDSDEDAELLRVPLAFSPEGKAEKVEEATKKARRLIVDSDDE